MTYKFPILATAYRSTS